MQKIIPPFAANPHFYSQVDKFLINLKKLIFFNDLQKFSKRFYT